MKLVGASGAWVSRVGTASSAGTSPFKRAWNQALQSELPALQPKPGSRLESMTSNTLINRTRGHLLQQKPHRLVRQHRTLPLRNTAYLFRAVLVSTQQRGTQVKLRITPMPPKKKVVKEKKPIYKILVVVLDQVRENSTVY